ncbi:MAG: EAL domain-containing protein, partial [Campylobacterales bacterium]|nr:EAL domain-containing protein [Campylobacterales bacterium]
MDNSRWDKIVSKLDFAFQPIVNIATGQLYGVEALLRNYKEAGDFHSVHNCFDEAFQDGYLYQLDLELREKLFTKFSKFDFDGVKLFYNIDSRVLYMPDYRSGNTVDLISKFKISKKNICMEISERKTLQDPNGVKNMINRYKYDGFDVAVDDFGTGVSGLQLLYYADATYIKIDRFFIDNIEKDSKKRLFFASIVNMAHIMGIKVIAEGVETIKEYYTVKDIGVDFIQGYLVQKPKKEIEKIKPCYNHINNLYSDDKRGTKSNYIKKEYIDYIEPIYDNTDFHSVIVHFKKNIKNSFAPIIDKHHRLLGVIYDSDIKGITYSQYGMALSKNHAFKGKLESFMEPAISVERYWGVDKTLEIFNMSNDGVNGIFVTHEGKYFGFINLNNLLSMSYKRNIEIAKNQNPLTKLPGNEQIQKYLFKALEEESRNYICYFDFNDFKPFNDIYGFRQGDRAILLFADILRKYLKSSVFVGHIGGDDF